MVPRDAFPPHGYLDNPFHTRNLRPSGVVRSQRGIGFGWHFPALARGYGYREVYRAGLRLYLADEAGVRLELADFPGIVAVRHTKNEVAYAWSGDGLELEATWFLVGEHTLACRARLRSDRPRTLTVGAVATYDRHLGAAGVWGESGLVGRVEGDAVVLQGFEDGEAFALTLAGPAARERHAGATARLDAAFLAAPSLPRGPGDPGAPDASTAPQAQRAAGAPPHAVVTGRRGDTVSLAGALALRLDLQAGTEVAVEALLGRAIRRDLALAEVACARTLAPTALAAHRAADEAFWRDAPQLRGAWPDAWRRGLTIDLETLRMMVRAPIGIYRHVWDAMQIQAPRVVLAEAAIDALLLSYADLPTAKALLLGTFLDAPAPNVPCGREDGSYNMVGADGSECGTAPEWGYPARVVAHLFARDGDRAWLEAILPPLEALLAWWDAERSDADGYAVYDNSWESGQDLSARFGPQKEGGGSTIRAVRPVDLQAAMADAWGHVAAFRRVLGRDPSAAQARADHYRALTAGLWHDGAYRDHDARVGWSDVWDVMQLAPVALGLAESERVAALHAALGRLDRDAYLWPMFVWTAVDAAHEAGAHGTAAEIVRATCDRAYAAWDRREAGPDDPLPGITCEYWGTDGRFGAEGYGWGAFGVHLVFRSLLGYRPLADGFALRPNLPADWPDGVYGVTNLNAGARSVDLELDRRGDRVHLTLTARRDTLSVGSEEGATVRCALGPGEEIRVVTRHGTPHP